MKKLFVIFLLIFVFVGCSFDENKVSNFNEGDSVVKEDAGDIDLTHFKSTYDEKTKKYDAKELLLNQDMLKKVVDEGDISKCGNFSIDAFKENCRKIISEQKNDDKSVDGGSGKEDEVDGKGVKGE